MDTDTAHQGAMDTPRTFTYLLMMASILFGITVAMLFSVGASERETRDVLRATEASAHAESEKMQREMRLMQLHFEEFNAILVREGFVKPGDYLRGPTAPTQPVRDAPQGEGK